MNETHWLPGIVVLVGGLLVAALFLYSSWQKAPSTGHAKRKQKQGGQGEAQEGTLEDLDRRAQMLIDQLKELTAERHHLSPERFAAEKARLEAAAAAALRAKDEYLRGGAAAPPPPSPSPAGQKDAAASPPNGYFGRHPQLAGALWGAGVVGFVVVVALLLRQNEQARGERDSMTGNNPNQAAGQPQQDTAFEQAVELARNFPDNVPFTADVVHELILRQRLNEATLLTERSLAIDPFHVETRIHHAAMAAARGDPDGAVRKLQHLADTYPGAHEALLFLGSLHEQRGELRGALESFERFVAEAPSSEQVPELQPHVAALRQQLGL